MEDNAFTGAYSYNLDEKGRLMLPARLRVALSDTRLVLTCAIESCLWVFPRAQWDRFSSQISARASLFHAPSRAVLRRLIAPAQEVELDRAWRLFIPPSLREYAALEKDCLILGLSHCLEIWDRARYRAYLAESEADFRAGTETLQDLCP